MAKAKRQTNDDGSSSSSPPPEVNFLVMQSYKTLVCFLTCWLVVFLGEEIRFSYWGIVSGLFWVPGAAAGIYGIRTAGLATAVGTWSAIQVLTSFVFGIIVFEEEVRSIQRAFFAFLFLVAGLVGMARYAGMGSAAEAQEKSAAGKKPLLQHSMHQVRHLNKKSNPLHSLSLPDQMVDDVVPLLSAQSSTHSSTTDGSPSSQLSDEAHLRKSVRNDAVNGSDHGHLMLPLELEQSAQNGNDVDINYSLLNGGPNDTPDCDDEERVAKTSSLTYRLGVSRTPTNLTNEKNPAHKDYVIFCGGRFALHKRQVGILGAVINGAWGGCCLIPLHYAKRDHGLSGAAFLISYATGAMIVNTLLWLSVFLYYKSTRSWQEAAHAMPRWYWKDTWKPGFSAGILYSMGNFCSILAVTYLGQATGYSMCQLQLFVSGLWAVFWFREIKRPAIIAKWFASAGSAILGIIWLSLEHKGGVAH
eukprot:CAMPEP_0168719614 /NCGR_PEP_ID=MMETSP0724-20121128/1129_1 /TAXON_ID=265536 /ORGANISM="Amphiprora sp., Strain CCMP467" /LENGTH=471 /DNA_ID=CAMNT_0008766173 /DNA_START=533 /DNA_END=1948 /DNA_ORIENTATION=-